MSSGEESSQVSFLDEGVKQAVIAEYLHEQKDRRGMEQAMREAEIALMNHQERFKFASGRLHRRKETFTRDLQKSLDQYRKVLLSCPLNLQQVGDHYIQHEFPFLILPRQTAENMLLQVRQSVEARLSARYGQHSIIHEVSEEWYQTTRQFLGLIRGVIPHPDVMGCMVPQQ